MGLIVPGASAALHNARMAELAAETAGAKANSVEGELHELKRRHERLLLANQVLWEIVREATGLADADFENRLAEADARDGSKDGRMTQTGIDCPACNRKTSSGRPTCLYCGEKVPAPLFARF